MRIGAWLLVAVLFVGALPFPVVSAAAETPASYGFLDQVSFFTGTPVTLREISWHPSGAYALIAGGIRGPATDPMNGYQILLKYENATGAVTPILNESAKPMLFAVRFAPDGSHALVVGEKDTILRYDHATGTVRNLFLELQEKVLTNDPGSKPPVFQGRGLAYNPTGRYAVVTGQEMIFYNDTIGFFTPTGKTVKPEGGGYYKAIGFAPDGSYALVEGGDTYPADDPYGRSGQARIGQLWFMGVTKERCARYLPDGRGFCLLKFALPYGYFDPNRADASDITFHPIINASFVYGYDDKYGSILRVRDNGTAPDVKQPVADYVPEWMAANHKEGKYTDMEFRPHGTRALVTAFGDPQLMEFDGLSVRPVLTSARCVEELRHECPTLESVAWHPSGSYAVAVGLYGSVLKVVPQPTPEVSVTSPVESETIVDKGATSVLVTGTAYATVFGTKIQSIRVAVDGGAWNEANFSARVNPVNWRWRWNVSAVQPGAHTLTVQAEDTAGHLSKTLNVTVYVALPPPPLPAPVIQGGNVTSRLGDFTLTWDAVPGATSYIVQDSKDPEFLDKVTWPVDAPAFESLSRDRGTYYFRVLASGAPRPDSPWSETVVVNVTEGRRVPTATDCDAPNPPPVCEVPPECDDPPCEVGPIPVDRNDTNGNATPPPKNDSTGNTTPPPPPADTPGLGLFLALVGIAAAVALRRR